MPIREILLQPMGLKKCPSYFSEGHEASARCFVFVMSLQLVTLTTLWSFLRTFDKCTAGFGRAGLTIRPSNAIMGTHQRVKAAVPRQIVTALQTYKAQEN